MVLAAWQKYDEARAAVARADTLDAGMRFPTTFGWAADVLEGKWADADAIARRESQLADPNWKWLGPAGVATVELYAGKSAAALRSMEASVDERRTLGIQSDQLQPRDRGRTAACAGAAR